MPQQNQFQPGIGTFQDFRSIAIAIAYYVTLTVLPVFRQKVGLEVLALGPVLIMAFLLHLIDSFSGMRFSLLGGVQSSGSGMLSLYALGFPVAAYLQRRARWSEIKSGGWWHTGSFGLSYFTFLPLREDRIYRNVDPALVFLLGLCLKNIGFVALGVWLMFAGICWRIVEEHVYQLSLKQFFAEGNSILEARMRARILRQFSGEEQAPLNLRESGGIPTGIDHSLAEIIAQRRREAQKEDSAA